MPVTVASAASSEIDADAAVDDIIGQLAAQSINPRLIIALYHHHHDAALIWHRLADHFPVAQIIGATSHNGLMAAGGLAGADAIGLLAIDDPDGGYGAATRPFGEDPAAASEQALLAALESADATGELPELVWIMQTPGREEAALTGLRRVVGDRCPIVGGGAADDDVSGQRRLLGPDGVIGADGIVVAALFPSCGVSVAYQGGYEPTGLSGVATSVTPVTLRGQPIDSTTGSGNGHPIGRFLATIDGRPAAEVYHEWMNGALPDDALARGGSIVDVTTRAPIAVEAGSAGEVTYFRLMQPVSVTADAALALGADVEQGATVHLMRGGRRSLVRRGARTVAAAANEVLNTGAEIAGAMVVYCMGCRAAVGDDIDAVVGGIARELDPAPFLGWFTGGEQGPALGSAIHSNLMVGAVVFAR